MSLHGLQGYSKTLPSADFRPYSALHPTRGLLAMLNFLITNSLPSQSLCMWRSLEPESNLYLLQQK